jgi:DNA-binding NarL/FixJ family response regulator
VIRVFLVEDTIHVRQMLRDIMELQGFEIAGEAEDARDIEMAVALSDPDVVIMDYRMPEIDGLEATRRLLGSRPGQAVILYSAFDSEELRQRAADAGVVAVVPKSEGVEALAREIAAVAMSLGRERGDDT